MKWNNMNSGQKIGTVIAAIAAVIAVIGMIKPDLFPVNVTTPAIAVFTLGEAVINWNQSRKMAYLMLAAAIISVVCFIAELLLL